MTPSKFSFRSSRGQVLVGVLVLLMVLVVLVPTMVFFIQNEAKWTAKQQQNTNAFHLAEAATERGYWRILQTTNTINILPLAGYNFDVSYNDISGGTYAIRITSNAAKDLIVVGVGRDAKGKEVRALEVIYSPDNLATNSEFSVGTNEIGGALEVHWGPVYSRTNLTGSFDDWPRLYALGTIGTGGGAPCPSCAATPPCTDSVRHWCCSCAPNKALPSLNYEYYKNLAIGYGAAPPGCHTDTSPPYGNPSYYRSDSGRFKGCTDLSGKVYYNDGGDMNFDAGAGGVRIYGAVILGVSSSININGNIGPGGGVCYPATVPPYAWKEYGKNATTWNMYRDTFDIDRPATFPGVNGTYQTSKTYSLCNVAIKGMLWDVGDMNLTGSGSTLIHGVAYTASGITGTGSMKLYYDNTQTLELTTGVTYARTSWKDLPGQGWPSGL